MDAVKQSAIDAARAAFRVSYIERTDIGNFNDLMRCAIADAIAAYEQALWQPIETAPRDRAIMVMQDGEQAVVTWMTAMEDGAGDWIIWRQVGPDAMAIRMPAPTHWRPLPEAWRG